MRNAAEEERDSEPLRGLDPSVYTRSSYYEAEVECLFRGGWLCVGRADQIPDVGDYMTLDLLEEPLLVVRGRDGRIRVLSRVCRHRSADLEPEAPIMTRRHASAFVCPYHAWSYRTDGRLAGAPMMQDVSGAERSTCRLPEFPTALWQGWVFVNLSADAPPFHEGLDDLDTFLAPYELDRMVVVDTATFASPWNWKVLVENFMESYHHIATHRESLQTLFPAKISYVPESGGPYSLLVMPTDAGAEVVPGSLPRRDLPDELATALVAGVVYPFHLFAVSADVLTWYQLLPEAHDRFSLRVSICVDPQAAENEEFEEARAAQMALTDHVHREDIKACDAVWSGLRSRGAVAGPLCDQERALHQFARWWQARMPEDGWRQS